MRLLTAASKRLFWSSKSARPLLFSREISFLRDGPVANESCNVSLRRILVDESSSVSLTELVDHEYLKQRFDMSLMITNHIGIVATPQDMTIHNGPTVVFREFWGGRKVVTWKESTTNQSKEDLGPMLGTFLFSEIASSFDAAETSSSKGDYDYIRNNCSALVLDIMEQLNVDPLRPDIISYSTEKLAMNGKLLKNTRASHNVGCLLRDGGAVANDDFSLAQRLLKNSIKLYYAKSRKPSRDIVSPVKRPEITA